MTAQVVMMRSIESRHDLGVLLTSDAGAMHHSLKVGDLLWRPHCRRWHPVVRWHSEGTAYTLRMLYFDCRGKRYYAGQENLEIRHDTKAAC